MRLLHVLSACLLFSSVALNAESRNPGDYPLRIRILGQRQTVFYQRRELDEAKGEGRANLFENSEAHAVDFIFDCSEKLKASFGYETYPAKWKKQNRELTVLLPVFGKSNSYWTCNLKTDVKDYVYGTHNGRIGSEPVEAFKAWMVKHDYDPEHGKNVPTRSEPQAGGDDKSASQQQ